MLVHTLEEIDYLEQFVDPVIAEPLRKLANEVEDHGFEAHLMRVFVLDHGSPEEKLMSVFTPYNGYFLQHQILLERKSPEFDLVVYCYDNQTPFNAIITRYAEPRDLPKREVTKEK